jgi:hypothetical protein
MLLFVLLQGSAQGRTYLSLPKKESLCMWGTENEGKSLIPRSNLTAPTTVDLWGRVNNTDVLNILDHDG